MCCFPFEDISKITLCRDLLFLLISNCFWHGQAFNNQLDYLFIIYSVPSMRDEFSKALLGAVSHVQSYPVFCFQFLTFGWYFLCQEKAG